MDLDTATVLELAAAIRRRETTSLALTEAYLGRIAHRNDTLQAFTSVQATRALRVARRKDQALEQADDVSLLPALHGVPFGIKDLVPVRGAPLRLGSRAYRYAVSPFDGEVAKRLKAGGIVCLGKLATSEFGAAPITEPDIHPPTRNPWNLDHTAGGSSGGSASAVAAGLLPAAHGSDGGGSVRIPSALCHLFGFKPSTRALGNLHGPVNQLGLSTMGPLTHTVEDAAALLDVMDGRSHHLSATSSYLSRCRETPRRCTIGVSYGSDPELTSPAIRAAVDRAAKHLADLGHDIYLHNEAVQADPDEFLPIWMFMLASVPSPSERYLQPLTAWLREGGRKQNPADIHRLHRDLSLRVLAWMGDFDLMLMPTVPQVAPKIGQFAHLSPKDAFDETALWGTCTAPFNITGQPAASLPAGLEDGLPYGVQLAGRVDADAQVLAVCRELETVMPWRHRRPAT